MNTLGERVKKAREALGLSQSELARAVGISPQSIQSLEADRSPTRTTRFLLQIAETLRVVPKWLGQGTGPMREAGAGLAEDDAAYDEGPAGGDRLLEALFPGRANLLWYRATNDALAERGIVSGDYLVCEHMDGDPAAGDAVVVSVADPAAPQRAQTWLRHFDGETLVPRSKSKRHKAVPRDADAGIVARVILRFGYVAAGEGAPPRRGMGERQAGYDAGAPAGPPLAARTGDD